MRYPHDGDNLIIEKYLTFRSQKRFDIIAFYPNGKDTEDYYIKRIITNRWNVKISNKFI